MMLTRLFSGPDGRIDWRLAAVFAIVNGLVLFNAVFHDPTVQYDSAGHLAYVHALAQLHLPSARESVESFSAPLPYLLPAIANAAGLSLWWAAKFGQVVNVALSLGITTGLIALCRATRSAGGDLPLIALMGLGTLPVYYKTMSFVRGEPYVAFLTLAGMAVTARALTSDRHSWADAIVPGLLWGLLVLARQWGALAAAAMLVTVWLVALRDRHRRQLVIGLAAPLVALAVSGWFFGWLWISHGSPIAFNRAAAEQWSIVNEPADFYTGTGNGKLFSDPVRPSFPNQLMPIFYAETWGDYWGFFSIYGKHPATGAFVTGPEFQDAIVETPLAIETNRYTLNGTLGRVALLGLLPTAVAVAAFIAAALKFPAFLRRGAPLTLAEVIPLMAILVIGVSLAGYLWFLVRFPNLGKGDTIKATYMLHIFAPLALLTAEFARRLRIPILAWLLGWGLLMLHNLPALTTHFWNSPQ